MLEGKSVAVVVPAHDEEALLEQTLAGIPGFRRPDLRRRRRLTRRHRRAGAGCGRRAIPRVELIEHERNGGVGAAIVTGYKRAVEDHDGRHRA